MPKKFEQCVDNDGRVRTLKGPNKKYNLKKNQYRYICFKNGEAYLGEIHTKEKKKK